MIGKLKRRLQLSGVGRLVLFLIVGGINTLLNYGVFLTLVTTGMAESMAVVVAWIVGIAFNFVSTGRVVFQSSSIGMLPRFVSVYLIQLGINIALLKLATHAGLDARIAQAAILATLAITTFFVMRRFVFVDASRSA